MDTQIKMHRFTTYLLKIIIVLVFSCGVARVEAWPTPPTWNDCNDHAWSLLTDSDNRWFWDMDAADHERSVNEDQALDEWYGTIDPAYAQFFTDLAIASTIWAAEQAACFVAHALDMAAAAATGPISLALEGELFLAWVACTSAADAHLLLMTFQADNEYKTAFQMAQAEYEADLTDASQLFHSREDEADLRRENGYLRAELEFNECASQIP